MDDTFSIRLSCHNDIERIMEVYESAKYYMRSYGNFKQWTGGYPDEKTISRDISRHCHYIAEDEEGNILMVFSFIIGEDPTYKVIENGAWLNDRPYGTIHRIASSGLQRNMLTACLRYCAAMIDNIRIDTHADNAPMLRALHHLNFKCCGVIYTADGSPRIAFQKDYRPTIVLPIEFN
ncbi:MAG: GNAT family N-acetyltransferase [Muribaculaceae bacterium]|nr:GNAT family N-acetyltransferase [Muribaculaceae bacterium]